MLFQYFSSSTALSLPNTPSLHFDRSYILALLCTLVFRFWLGIPYPHVLFSIVPVTVGIALLATFLTPAVDDGTLENFYRRIRPGGPGCVVE